MRRLLFYLFCFSGLSTLFGQSPVWDGSVADSFAGGTGTEEDPYQIATPAQLAKLAQDVNGGEDYEGVYFVQTEDLDLGGSEGKLWIPIGEVYSAEFSGCFDGMYNVVNNLVIENPDNNINSYGLFGNISNSGIIRQVVVNGEIKSEGKYTGGIAGSMNGVLEDCISNMKIHGSNYAGGCVGYVTKSGKINRVIFSGIVDNGYYQGGIAGYNGGSITEVVNLGLVENRNKTEQFLGGIAGFNSGPISYAGNYGSVYSQRYAGGIAGYHHPDGSINNCLNVAPIYGIGEVGTIMGGGKVAFNVYYDIQTASGLFTGDSYFDIKRNKAYTTQEFISGDPSLFDFTDNSKWHFEKGLYPQLSCFAESSISLLQALSALSATALIANGKEVWSALQSGFSCSDFLNYGDCLEKLSWNSENTELSFSDGKCVFSPSKSDKDLSICVTAEQSGFSKYFLFPYYAMFDSYEMPSYSDDSGVRIYNIESFSNMAWACGVANGFIITGSEDYYSNLSFENCILNIKNNIDFSGYTWFPMSGCCSGLRTFSGKINGNGFAIENLNIQKKDENGVGLIGSMDGGNSGIENLIINGGHVIGGTNVGAFVGRMSYGTIDRCENNLCNVEGEYICGGIVGDVSGVTISRCANKSDVVALNTFAGGIVGSLNSLDVKYSVCSETYNTGNVYSKNGYSGGITYAIGTYSQVKDCFNSGVIGGDNDHIGGIASVLNIDGTVSNCYNIGEVVKPAGFIGEINVGELLGRYSVGAYLTNNYYDKELAKTDGAVSGSDMDGATGLETSKMKNNADFVDILGDEIWELDSENENNGYPVLKWMKQFVSETNIAQSFVYPNPFIDRIYIVSDNVSFVRIFDISGKILEYVHDDFINGLDVSEYDGGVYIVHLYDNDGKLIGKNKIVKILK